MKFPGDPLLEFQIEPQDAQHCTIHQLALFKPFGLLYWYAVLRFQSVAPDGRIAALMPGDWE
jgi:hypothetical protein